MYRTPEKLRGWAALAAVLALLLSRPASALLIENGGFEDIESRGPGRVVEVPGWTTRSGTGVRILGNQPGSAFEGNRYAELDSRGNSRIGQRIETLANQVYELTLAYSPRPRVRARSNVLLLFWDGLLLDRVTASGLGKRDTDWQVLRYLVTGTGTDVWLELAGGGRSNGVGGLVDDVRLTPLGGGAPPAVPLPATALLLGGGLAGLAWVRRWRQAPATNA